MASVKKAQKPNSQNRKGHRRTTAREIAKTLWKLETCTVDNQNKDAEQVGCNCHQPNMNIPKIKKFLNFETMYMLTNMRFGVQYNSMPEEQPLWTKERN